MDAPGSASTFSSKSSISSSSFHVHEVIRFAVSVISSDVVCSSFSQVSTFSSSAAFTVRADKSTLLPTRAAVSNNTAILFPLSFHFFIISILLSKLWCSYTFCPHKDILLFSSHIQIDNMNKIYHEFLFIILYTNSVLLY